MQNLIINEDLKNLLPSLSVEEFAGLEESIVKDGCLSPLIVWNNVLVDGHHRYEICKRHELPFAIKNVVLDSLEDAKLWAWQHQANRRNLTPYHRSELALKLKDVIAARAKERQKGGQGGILLCPTLDKANSVDTKKELAELAEVSHGTLAKVEYISERADDETKAKLRKGEKGTSINKEYNRLKAEEKTVAEPETVSADAQASFRPGSLPTKKFVGETTLKPIPRDRPDILVGNLIAFFPEEFIPNTAREIFRMLHDRYGAKVTQPLAVEFYQQYGRRKK